MPRFTIRQGPIEVVYGFDFGVFLSVCDSRLVWNSDASDSVNEVATAVGNEDGGGGYVVLTTSKMGIGKHVDDSTMATYLARYGVSKEQILGLPLKLPDSHPIMNSFSMESLAKNLPSADSQQSAQCFECKASSTLVCGKCHAAHYCSKDCQKKNWAIHKVFCGMKTIPSRLDPQKSVQVVLLPNNGSSPSLIRIPKTFFVDEFGNSEGINTDDFFEVRGSIHSGLFPATKQAALKNSYEVVYKDDFLIDGCSTANLCIGKFLLDKRQTQHWRGNVLFCKTRLSQYVGDIEVFYEDITMSDIKDAVEFLQDYTQKKQDEVRSRE